MKKMLIFILVVSLFMALPVSAASTDIETDGNYYDSINDAFMVRGTIKNEIGNIPMTLKIILGNEIVYLTQTIAKAEDGVVSYEFPKMYLPATAKSGTYKIEVRSAFSTDAFTGEIKYAGADELFKVIQSDENSIISALTDKSESGILKSLSANEDELAIDYSTIKGLKEPGYFASLMLDETYELPNDLNSVSDKILVQETTKKLRSDIKENLSMAKALEIDTVADSKAWFEENKDYYEFTPFENEAGTVVTPDIYKYLDAHEEEAFAQRMVPNDKLRTKEDVKVAVEKALLLTTVQHTDNTTVVSDIISEFPEYFDGFSVAYKSLSVDKKGAVWNDLKGTSFATCGDLVEAANEYAKKLSGGNNESLGGGGGSGGGGGGGGGGASLGGGNKGQWDNTIDNGYAVTGQIVSDEAGNELQFVLFNDLPETHWAYAPILALCRRNIIRGYGDNTFKPEQAITRAEFIKILAEISLMPIDISGDGFSDVPETHWAYKYIKSARRSGLVTGGYENNFNPDDKITREDMLVILQRATNAPNGYANFADMGDAASYASGAIGYFSEKGIVNGMGDNMFMPKGETTRAQACKILNMLYQ